MTNCCGLAEDGTTVGLRFSPAPVSGFELFFRRPTPRDGCAPPSVDRRVAVFVGSRIAVVNKLVNVRTRVKRVPSLLHRCPVLIRILYPKLKTSESDSYGTAKGIRRTFFFFLEGKSVR